MSDIKINGVIYIQEEDLKHHGIKGQKWGVENGPPYPLGGIRKLGKTISNKLHSAAKTQKKKSILKATNKELKRTINQYSQAQKDASVSLLAFAVLNGLSRNKMSRGRSYTRIYNDLTTYHMADLERKRLLKKYFS